jgi:hypothetical protein
MFHLRVGLLSIIVVIKSRQIYMSIPFIINISKVNKFIQLYENNKTREKREKK